MEHFSVSGGGIIQEMIVFIFQIFFKEGYRAGGHRNGSSAAIGGWGSDPSKPIREMLVRGVSNLHPIRVVISTVKDRRGEVGGGIVEGQNRLLNSEPGDIVSILE